MEKVILSSFALLALSTNAFADSNHVKINLKKGESLETRVERLYQATNPLCKEIGPGHIMPRIRAKVKNISSVFHGNIEVETQLDSFCKYKLDSIVLTFIHKGKLAYNSTYIANYTKRSSSAIYDIDCAYENETKMVCASSDIINFDHDNTAEIRVELNQ